VSLILGCPRVYHVTLGCQLFTSSPGLRTLIDKVSPPVANGEEYDPHKREPQHAHAQSSALWELVRLLVVVNPVVLGAYEFE
jgi:ribosome biogenesis protein MAK21